MKLKGLQLTTCAVIMSTMLGTTAFANTETGEDILKTETQVESKIEKSDDKQEDKKSIDKQDKKEKKKPTDKQKDEMKGKMKEAQKKWDALSKEQKEEVYKIKEKSFESKCQLIDKYLELGIIDKETADSMKAKMTEHKSEMQKSGKMPGFGGKGKH